MNMNQIRLLHDNADRVTLSYAIDPNADKNTGDNSEKEDIQKSHGLVGYKGRRVLLGKSSWKPTVSTSQSINTVPTRS
ncbi:hypothetical protein BN1723_004554 [Verticillium longisporum]|uniref:Uncharacterized protein n=1 Tax=Verticillium longisporum TaxID=100787 RepID=A0A0G4MAN5_VERLO|nr:hypothetical protein BN1708_005408 [Verticillium longisporum]CRK39315.1 hypothetical protein BN1723_004554 [Verticillium longisporum]